MRYKYKSSLKKKILIIIIALLFLFSIFKVVKALVQEDSVIITDVQIVSKSENVDINNYSFEKTKIIKDVAFHNVGDTVEYRIKVKNNDKNNYIIKSVSVDNSNDYVSYSCGNYEGTKFNSKEDIYIEITEKYINEVQEMTNRDQNYSINLNFVLEDEQEETETNTSANSSTNDENSKNTGGKSNKDKNISLNPETGDDIVIYSTIAIISLAIIIVLSKKKNVKTKNGAKLFSLILIGMLILPITAKAQTIYSVVFKIENRISLQDKLLFIYEIDGEQHEKIVKYGEKVTKIENPSKEGYIFIEWQKEDGAKFDFNTELKSDEKVVAKFETISYGITYVLNDGALEGTNPEKYTIETDDIKLKNPTKEGYEFEGWTGSNGETPQKDVIIPKGSTGDRSYTANFTPNTNTEYTVIHELMDVDGTTYIEKERNVEHGTTDTEVTPETKTYPHFTAPAKQTVKINGNGKTTVVYQYTRDKYHITFIDAEFIEGNPVSDDYYYEKEIELTAKDKVGHEFSKWTNDETNKTIVYKVTGTASIGPVYTAKEYTINFDSDGGNAIQPVTVIAGNSIGELPVPRKENYKFRGWYTDKNYTTKVESTTKPTESATYYAKWIDRMSIVFSIPTSVTFNGRYTPIASGQVPAEYLGTDEKYVETNVALFNEKNYDKDFEIGFTIDNYSSSAQDPSALDPENNKQFSFFNTKDENGNSICQGIVFRVVQSNKEKLELIASTTTSTNVRFNSSDVTSIKIYRENKKIYYSINGGEKIYLTDRYQDYLERFNTTVTFGASKKADGTPFRHVNATLSNMYIMLENDDLY